MRSASTGGSRHGHLFQNRYKSILCAEEPYLLELVRCIHLNPLRARLVENLGGLDRYPYSGHCAIMGKAERPWQDLAYVIKLFEKTRSKAIRGHRQFVERRISTGRRPDLVGGGLIRSAGGWSSVKMLRKHPQGIKSDECILGSGGFVEEVLNAASENLERKYAIRTGRYDFDWLVGQVAQSLEMRSEEVYTRGRYKSAVTARSLLCYWGMRELGMTTVELGRRLGLSQATISQSAMRGRQIANLRGLQLNMA